MADTPDALAWIGRGVRNRRVNLALSQSQLADVLTTHMGMPMDQPSIAALEAGKRQVGVIEFMVFAAALQCTVDYLLSGTKEGEWVRVPGPGEESQIITPTEVDLGTKVIDAFALSEVLDDGWTEDTTSQWALNDEDKDLGIVDPYEVFVAIDLMTRDPETEALISSGFCSREELERALPLAAEMVTDDPPVGGPWTMTKLLNHLVDERIREIPDGVTDRGRRTIASAQRRRIIECLKEALSFRRSPDNT